MEVGMIISILQDKPYKDVCLTQEAVSVLVQNNHIVLIEGEADNKTLAPYLNVGAYIINTKEELLDRGDVIIKKTEPKKEEVGYLNGEEKILFTKIDFVHEKLIKKMLEHKLSVIDYSLLKDIKKGVVKTGDIVAFSNYVLPFLLGLANKRMQALVDDEILREALIVMNGKVYNSEFADLYRCQCYEF